MMRHTSAAVMLIGVSPPLALALDAWVRAQITEPLDMTSAASVSEALADLRSRRVDLVLVDEAAARHELRAIHEASPATAIVGVGMNPDKAAQLRMLRQGAHETICLLPSKDLDQQQALERALARVNGRADILIQTAPQSSAAAAPPRLIHDLNNLLTSINGFADLLLNQLPPDHPSRMGAEQIRLSGKRATALLKAQSPGSSSLPPSSSPVAPSIASNAA
ncbi:MAG: hypothetical protein IT389_07035 [Nitrospira sp.]|nr:hypothetical protein [Nitrospira sp.]